VISPTLASSTSKVDEAEVVKEVDVQAATENDLHIDLDVDLLDNLDL
jgi:hypothetical protein